MRVFMWVWGGKGGYEREVGVRLPQSPAPETWGTAEVTRGNQPFFWVRVVKTANFTSYSSFSGSF